MVNRRTFCTTIGGISSTIGLAGCVDDLSSSITSDRSPEDTVRQYYSAFDESDVEVLSEVVYDPSSEISDEDIESFDGSVVEVNLKKGDPIKKGEPLEDDEFDSEDEAAIEEIKEILEEVGATEYISIVATVTTENGQQHTNEEFHELIKIDGEWQIIPVGLYELPYAIENESTGEENTQEESTGEENTQEVSDRLQVSTATGDVTDEETIDHIIVTVARSPGSGDIDLNDVTYELSTSDESATGSVSDNVDIEKLQGGSDDAVLSDSSDRYELGFNLQDIVGQVISSGDVVELSLTTATDGKSRVELKAPDSLEDEGRVRMNDK